MNAQRAAPGRFLLRWWFPRADTPTCAACAGELREHHAALAALGVDALGISLDSQEVLDAWHEALDLPYPLVSATWAQAAAMGALRPQGDPWRDVLAARTAALIDDAGTEVGRWDPALPQILPAEVGQALSRAKQR